MSDKEKKKPEKKEKQQPLITFKEKNWHLKIFPNEKAGRRFILAKYFKGKGGGFAQMSISFMPLEIKSIFILFEQFRTWNLKQKEGAKEQQNEQLGGN
jgi:hypothetical protein